MQPKVATKSLGKNLTSPQLAHQFKNTPSVTASKISRSPTTPPNVPTKERGSFFSRKYRELVNCQLTPMTPKIDKSRCTTQRGRRTRTGEQRKTSPNNAGRSKRPQQSYCLDSEYTTPRTTRTSLTPASIRNGRVVFDRNPQLIYGPLGLDNESSSESTDMLIRTKIHRMSQERRRATTPLAIEGPDDEVELIEIDVTPCDVQSTYDEQQSNQKLMEEAVQAQSPETRTTTIVAQQQQQNNINKTPNGSAKPSSQTPPLTPVQKPKTTAAKTPSPDKGTERKCLSPKQTHQEVDVNTGTSRLDQTPKQQATFRPFVPGSCNINDILKYYGARSRHNASSKSNVKAGN